MLKHHKVLSLLTAVAKPRLNGQPSLRFCFFLWSFISLLSAKAYC